MSPDLTTLRLMLGYTKWAGERLLSECIALQQQQLEAESGGTLGSISRLLNHMYLAERDWLTMLQARALPALETMNADNVGKDGLIDVPDLARLWPEVWAAWHSWMATLTPEDLESTVLSRLPDGRPLTFTVGELMLHCFNHASMHRGQVITTLRMVGAPSRNCDLMGFLIARNLLDLGSET
ncbi:MAG: DinB family protein [Acidobacteriales bacterium]|nr:DinB family protein [Terriglobales bacterium]ODU53934.1 MAG: hypothetical protein ABT04_03735 [Granulicella sp. SCN 62-9]